MDSEEKRHLFELIDQYRHYTEMMENCTDPDCDCCITWNNCAGEIVKYVDSLIGEKKQ